MRRLAVAVTALAAVCVIGLNAQTTTDVPTKGPNPHVQSQWMVDGATISITYGRPSLKGRSLDGFEWWGSEWRAGADERTKLTTDKPLNVGPIDVAAGSYGVYVKTGDAWELVLSKAADGWGIPYPAGEDLGRAPMRLGTAPEAAELVTFSIEDTDAGATLHLDWGTTRASIDFEVDE